MVMGEWLGTPPSISGLALFPQLIDHIDKTVTVFVCVSPLGSLRVGVVHQGLQVLSGNSKTFSNILIILRAGLTQMCWSCCFDLNVY